MNINKDYLFGSRELKMMSLSKMTPIGITIHNTYNFAPAINEAKNQFNNNTKKGVNGVAVHFYVDENEIYQLLPLDYHGWHAGDGAGKGNKQTIAIEICRSRDYESDNYKKAEELTVALVQKLMKDLNFNSSNLYKHQDWSGKKCPHRMLEGSPRTWDQFKGLIVGGAKPVEPKPQENNGLDSRWVGLSIDTVARQVINGDWYSGQARVDSLTRYGYDYQTVQNRVNEILYGSKPVEKPKPAQKTVNQLADEVINGNWGSGNDRKNRLTKAGYNYDEVQAVVNNKLYGIVTPSKSISKMAKEVIDGKHGNGHANRQKSLGIDNATYQKVRAEVNKRV